MRRPLATLAVLATALAAAAATSLPAAAAPDETSKRGDAAVRHLGDRLPAVAKAYGTDAATLKGRFAKDDALHVDKDDKLFYVDPAPRLQKAKPSAAKPGGGGGGGTVSEPTGEPFTLHSKPGAARTIYLDFTGHGGAYGGAIGGAWSPAYTGGDGVAEPYSTDSSLAFSAAELDDVRAIYERVAEDYAAFDVDVTTQKPADEGVITRSSSSDQVYGTRVAFTSTANSCGCGGVAYVGVFDQAGTTRGGHAWYQPAFVYNRGSKAAGEAASHEAGHNLGLSHDGTVAHDGVAAQGYYRGHGAWAPIMGVGYDRPVVQWSSGEYPYADNKEDDYGVMALNGLGALTDDLPAGTSTPVVLGTPARGVVERSGDRDSYVFRPTTSGTVTVRVAPVSSLPNVDLRLQAGVTGQPPTTAETTTTALGPDAAAGLDASLTLSVTSGESYTIDVVGAGSAGSVGDPGYGPYGSLGRYVLTVG